jgi:hypothetical protein
MLVELLCFGVLGVTAAAAVAAAHKADIRL